MILKNTKINLSNDFFEEEIRYGYAIASETKKLWAVELDLLCEFDRVCKKLNLRYFLDSGTLLGAVRDGKFIPWDNDIDIVMLRKDYDILLDKGMSEFKKPYFLQSAYSDKNYIRAHAQLRNSNTSGILLFEKDVVDFNQGLFLDIFVLDGVLEDENELCNQYKKLNKIKKRLWIQVYKKKSIGIKRIVKGILSVLYKLIYGNIKKQYIKYEDTFRNNSVTKYVDKVGFRESEKQIKRLEYKLFDNAKNIKFEGYYFPIPIGYDNILKVYYGEHYLTPQMEPSMHGEGDSVIFDAEKPYTDYL